MDLTKKRIESCVKEYIRLFPDEYEAFLQSHRINEENKANKYAEFQGSDHLVRHLFDLPELLFTALHRALTDDELDWLFSKNTHTGNRKGLSWFIRRFPQFKITKEF